VGGLIDLSQEVPVAWRDRLSQASKVFVQENQDTGALRPYLREMEAVTVSAAYTAARRNRDRDGLQVGSDLQGPAPAALLRLLSPSLTWRPCQCEFSESVAQRHGAAAPPGCTI
jgi:hypothetical protein